MDFEINSQVPDDWAIKSVSDVCVNVTSGGTPSRRKPEYYENGIYNWIKTKELDNGWIRNTEELITEDALKRSSAKLLPKNTVLLAMYGATVGELGILASEMTCNQACCAMIVDPEQADYRYLFYLLLSQKNNIKLLATGAAQQNLSATQIKSFKFPFPDIEVQKVIAKIIGDLDDKIELNRQTNQTLEHIAQAIFKSWFVDFEPTRAKIAARQAYHNLTPAEKAGVSEQHYIERAAICAISGKTPEQLDQLAPETQQQLKNTAALFPDALVDSELGEVPDGWGVNELKGLSIKISKGTTPRKLDVANAKDQESIPFLKVRDISNDGEIKRTDLDEIPESVHSGVLKRSVLETHDLLFSIAGTIGRVAIVEEDLNNSNCNQAVAFVRLKEPAKYLELCRLNLVGSRVQDEVVSKIVQGVQANFSLSGLGEINILIPSIEMLDKFNENIVSVGVKQRLLLSENRKLAEFRNTLLPKLLSGEINLNESKNSAEKVV